MLPRVDHGNGCIVEQTESRAEAPSRTPVPTRMMTRGSSASERIGVVAAHGDVDSSTGCASCTQGCL